MSFFFQTWFKNRRVKWRKQQRKQLTDAASTAASVSNGMIFHYFGHVPYPNNKLMLNDARMLNDQTTAYQDARMLRDQTTAYQDARMLRDQTTAYQD